MTADELLLLDFEASGLGPVSYPIEAGWTIIRAADGELLSGPTARLIAPDYLWPPSVWEPAAEAVHGISQAEIIARGSSAAAVARLICEAAEGRLVLVTHTEDIAWLNKLLRAAGSQGYTPSQIPEVQSFQVELAHRLDPKVRRLSGLAAQHRLRAVAARIGAARAGADAALTEQGLRPHQAGVDALHMAIWWYRAMGAGAQAHHDEALRLGREYLEAHIGTFERLRDA